MSNETENSSHLSAENGGSEKDLPGFSIEQKKKKKTTNQTNKQKNSTCTEY